MKTGVFVSDLMTKNPISISPPSNMTTAARTMRDAHVGALLVMDEGELLGIVTEQDIVRQGIAEGLDPELTAVNQLMARQLVTVHPDTDVYDALLAMRDGNFRHLPVLDGIRMAGLVTLKDILRIQPQLFDLLVDRFELREMEDKLRVQPREGYCHLCGDYTSTLSDFESVQVCPSCKRDVS